MNRRFNPMKARFRATFAAGQTNEARMGNVDRENEVLHDVQITLEGEALGHDVWLDRQFCEDCAAAGNATGDAGLKVRFGHPSMCADALGTFLGRAYNFRVVEMTRKDGSAAAGVIADIALAKESHNSPRGDLAAWIMDAAENSPDTFGQSIVFTYADFKVKDAEGGEHSYAEECGCGEDKKKRMSYDEWLAQSADGHVYAVLGKLHGTDFTDTPAATDGVFSADSLAAQVSDFLAENPKVADILENHPQNVVEFLTREGFWDRIESKRCSNLQAAKDKVIADLQADLDAVTKERDELSAAADTVRKEVTKEFEARLSESDAALAEANAKVSGLTEKVTKVQAALDDTAKQLERWKANAAELGSRVNTPPQEVLPTMEDGLAKCRTPAERSAFLAAGKYTK